MTKAELETQLAELEAKLAEKDQLILQQGEALKGAVQGSGDPAELNAAFEASKREAEELRAQLVAQDDKLKRLGVGADIEKIVRVKMAMGLSREDAIVCARRQAAHDEVMTSKYANETERREAAIAAASLS